MSIIIVKRMATIRKLNLMITPNLFWLYQFELFAKILNNYIINHLYNGNAYLYFMNIS